jgi:predicted nucleic acid-binding protein
MCIVVDTNTLASVFDKTSANHAEFKPVFDWVIEGKGQVVFGGSKYLKEITKYLGLFRELRNARLAILVDSDKVDVVTAEVSAKVQDEDFDDQHLVALLIVSGCKLICSLDRRAYPYFTHAAFFTPANNRPRIYSSSRNEDLLVDAHIADICKPSAVTTKAQKQSLTFLQTKNK